MRINPSTFLLKTAAAKTLLFGLLAFLAAASAAIADSFNLERYFEGRTYATGKFSAINGTTRTFDVVLTGDFDGSTLTLREDFAYDDGVRETKTWRFTKTGPNTYTGTREDVVGSGRMRVTGNRATLTYRIDISQGEDPFVVEFFDTFVLRDNGILENRALVTKFGLPIGRAAVNFARDRATAQSVRPR